MAQEVGEDMVQTLWVRQDPQTGRFDAVPLEENAREADAEMERARHRRERTYGRWDLHVALWGALDKLALWGSLAALALISFFC